MITAFSVGNRLIYPTLQIIINFATMLQKDKLRPIDLLRDYKLSHTKIRENLLDVLIGSDIALSATEIGSNMQTTCDRVTLYRNLKLFVERGIVHQIYVDNFESKYVLPDRGLQHSDTDSEHIHFKCMNCNVVQCMHDNPVTPVNLPDGFKQLEANFVVFGLCKTCNHNQNIDH
jgi:Fur family transcriptional regulator, ferric uptake regulator